MKALIIYDSIFGNTEKIASAIGGALGSAGEVAVVRVGDVKPGQWMGMDLLLVGSPTRGFRPTPAIKSFLQSIPANSLGGVKVAAFDTRILPEDVKSPILSFFVKLFGYAAKPIASALQKKGGRLIVPPEGFAVVASEGPLKAGELGRAETWAAGLATTLASKAQG